MLLSLLVLMLCSSFCNVSALSKQDLELVDGGVVNVNGVVLLRSDFKEPRILKGGVPYETQELITEELVAQKAQEYGMTASPLEIQSRINSMKEDNNQLKASDAEWDAWLKTSDLSSDRLNRQLSRGIAVPRLKEAMLPSKDTVSNTVIEDYCQQNPEYEELYDLSTAFFSNDDIDLMSESINWISIDKVEKTDLRDDMMIVENMTEGSISDPFKSGEQYQVVKVIKRYPRRLKEATERKEIVTKVLFTSEKEKREKKFIDQLSQDAVVTYLPGFQYEVAGA